MTSSAATETSALLIAQEEEPVVMFNNPCIDHASLSARLEAGPMGFSDYESDLESNSSNGMQHNNWLGHMAKGPAKKRNPQSARRCFLWLLAAVVTAAAGAVAGVVLLPKFFPNALSENENMQQSGPPSPSRWESCSQFLPPALPSTDEPTRGEKSGCLCNSLVIGGSLAAVGGAVVTALLCCGNHDEAMLSSQYGAGLEPLAARRGRKSQRAAALRATSFEKNVDVQHNEEFLRPHDALSLARSFYG